MTKCKFCPQEATAEVRMEPEVYTPVCDWHLDRCIWASFGWRPIKEEEE